LRQARRTIPEAGIDGTAADRQLSARFYATQRKSIMAGPLAGIRVFDMSRILAGPTCTQLLGDLGADVIKIERPGAGDDTRKWGPPFLPGKDGTDTGESAYYLSSNRNKRSITLDVSKPAGQALARRLIAKSDIMIENFKTGDVARYGLGWNDLKADHPGLIYCSITGFGQTGPYAKRPGYDLLAQGMGGVMSITGEADRPPMKVGLGIADVMCGMYATVAILGALHHRGKTGEGQYIDLALLDTQVAWLINVGLNYLISGEVPQRIGNEHPNIVPYNVLPSSDGFFILAAGNDGQFQRFCEFAACPALATDPRFVTNAARVANRKALYAILPDYTKRKPRDEWVEGLAKVNVPASPVNDIGQVFEDPQIAHRGMKRTVPHPLSADGTVDLISNPINYSATPVEYRNSPPFLGQHTDTVLGETLGLSADELAALRKDGVI
jgi:crotonobetainyl-CoA:carnitine CoA-transferase CaiB-like acyl-CoA transferase